MLSAMKFKIILWGMAQLLAYAAWRHPAFRARLKERNLLAQLKARDEEIGRWYAIRDGKVTSGSGLRADAEVTLAFKTAAIAADLLMPPINWLDQINAQKDFKLTVEGPEDLTNWFAQTIMMSQSVGLKIGTRLADGTMRYCNMTNGGPVFVYVKDGKIVRMTPIDFGADDPPPWTIEARGLQPERRAQSAEPRQVGLRAHLLAGSARPRRRRDQAAQAQLRSRRHGGVARFPSHLGQYRLLPLRVVPLPQRGRLHADPPQSRQLGRLVLGRGASLGLHAARRPIGDLRHGRRLLAELRHDRVLGCRAREHQRLVWCAGRHRAPAMAEGSQARHQGGARRSVLQRVGAIPAGQVVRAQAHHLGRDGHGHRLCLDQGRPLRQGVRKDPHRRLRQMARLSSRRRGRHRQDAGVAGERDRRPGKGRAHARARMGRQARLSRT